MGDDTREAERTYIGHLVVAFLEAAPEGARIEVERDTRDGRTFLTFIRRVPFVADRTYLRVDASCLDMMEPRSDGRGMARQLRKAIDTFEAALAGGYYDDH